MSSRVFEVAISIFLIGFVLTFAPRFINILPTPQPDPGIPLSPTAEAFKQTIIPLVVTDETKRDIKLLGSCIRSSSNLFVLDLQREKPFYDSLESRKWAIRRTDESTFGLGFSVKSRYPEIAAKLADFMNKECGETPTPESVNVALYNLGLALESI